LIIPNFRPLAAGKVRGDDDEAWTSDDWLIEEKLDGARYLYVKDDRGVRFLSRHISVETGELVNKAKSLGHLTRELDFLPPGTVLDGEIWQRGKKSNYITHVIGSLPKRALELQRAKGFLDYVVFDLVFYAGRDLRGKTLRYRRKLLEKALALGVREHVKIVRYEANNKENFYRRIVEEEDGEGGILKHLDSLYPALDDAMREKRYQLWKKAKKFQTYDCVIVGYTDPEEFSVNIKGETVTNKNFKEGWISGIIFAQYVPKADFDLNFAQDILLRYPNKKETYRKMIKFCNAHEMKTKNGKFVLQPFGVTVGMNYEVRRLLSTYKNDYLGSIAEIGAQERTETGALRHPRFVRFRSDKSMEYAVYRKDEA
jgi:ATP-dependent DNA ligase